jgi:hypothetical protein
MSRGKRRSGFSRDENLAMEKVDWIGNWKLRSPHLQRAGTEVVWAAA